ncbi:hypothetical protein CPB86DRAFT_722159, partial [Serendipita vermifera]
MLPVEIWQMILRYTISAPDFLDPDYWVNQFPSWVHQNQGRIYLGTYTQAEKILKSLRMVCKSWNRYLRQYSHRFVQMHQIVHGVVPKKYLRSAVRIGFEGHTGSYCKFCKVPPDGPAGPPGSDNDEYFQLVCKILREQQPLRAEIVDIGPRTSEIAMQLLSPHTFPNLARIQ